MFKNKNKNRQKGFQMLADPGSFDSSAFALLLRVAFQSLLDAQADEAVLGKPLGSELDQPGWRGAQRRAARPSKGGKPWEEEVFGLWLCPSLRTECGVVALPEHRADPEHCCSPSWHLHTFLASYTVLARLPFLGSLFLCKARV